MPINELEKHPFLDYYKQSSKRNYTGLIIGSFPIYQLTRKAKKKKKRTTGKTKRRSDLMPFFYGSNMSELWKILAAVEGGQNPKDVLGRQRKTRAIEVLENLNLLMTDVIKSTNRKQKSAADKDLWKTASQKVVDGLQLNYSILKLLTQFKTIKNLYFTSTVTNNKSPYWWFKKIVSHTEPIETDWFPTLGRKWSCSMEIDGRKYNIFLLPTPKARGCTLEKNAFCPCL